MGKNAVAALLLLVALATMNVSHGRWAAGYAHGRWAAGYAAAYRLWEHHTDNGLRALAKASTGMLVVHKKATDDYYPDCTATTFAKTRGGYRLLTAAHCVNGDDVSPTDSFFVDFPDGATYPLKLEYLGSVDAADYAVFSFLSEQDREYIPIGDASELEVADKVEYAGYAGMYGQQWFEGTMSRVKPAPKWIKAQWPNEMLVQIAGGPGTSGSALVSVRQRAIVGVLTGRRENSIGSVAFFPPPVLRCTEWAVLTVGRLQVRFAAKRWVELKTGPLVLTKPVIHIVIVRLASAMPLQVP